MRKLTTFLFAVLLCLALALSGMEKNADAATPRSVYIVDRSSVVHTSDLANALPAFQSAVSDYFAPIWGQDAQLILSDTPPAGAWRITVEDNSTVAGALGYHDFQGTVYGRVFVRTSLNFNVSWQSVFTHELFELLADPYVNRLVLGKRLWLVEVSDPVEDDRFNFALPGANGGLVPISDFVTPAWYRKAGSSERLYDFMGYITRPGQLLVGGYASFWTGSGWGQVFGRGH